VIGSCFEADYSNNFSKNLQISAIFAGFEPANFQLRVDCSTTVQLPLVIKSSFEVITGLFDNAEALSDNYFILLWQ
jgi:hypothetical protein